VATEIPVSYPSCVGEIRVFLMYPLVLCLAVGGSGHTGTQWPMEVRRFALRVDSIDGD
jgi:hypothetical protein